MSSDQAWDPVRLLVILRGRVFYWKTSSETACRMMPYLGSRSVPAGQTRPPADPALQRHWKARLLGARRACQRTALGAGPPRRETDRQHLPRRHSGRHTCYSKVPVHRPAHAWNSSSITVLVPGAVPCVPSVSPPFEGVRARGHQRGSRRGGGAAVQAEGSI